MKKLILCLLFLAGCSTDMDIDMPPIDPFYIKYEIRGSGTVDVCYTDFMENIIIENGITLPWIYDFEYPSYDYCEFLYISVYSGNNVDVFIYNNGNVIKSGSGNNIIVSTLIDEYNCYK